MSGLGGPRLSAELALPETFATMRAAIVARSGGGKSYTAAVLAEEMVEAGQPFYALDPTGAWWGLRASANGKRAGLPVIVIGGEHGDVDLDPAGGAAIADLVVGEPSFYVIDMSDLGTRAAEVRFATAFLDRLYRAKAKNRSALHGFWDEADLLAPQRSGPDEARMLGAAESVVRRGRIRGLGTTLITQRPAVVNKNVLSQIDVLIALKLGAPQDRKAVKDWLDGAADPATARDVMDSIASLSLGEAWVYAPAEDPPLYERIQVRERRTFNSSATGGGDAAEPVELATVDLAALRTRLAASIEKTKADDPKALRARIKALEAQVAELDDEDSTGAECSRLEDDMLAIHDALADAGLPGFINADSIIERIASLSAFAAERMRRASAAEQIVEAVRDAVADFTQGDGAARSAPSDAKGVQSSAAPARPRAQAPADRGTGRTALDGDRGRSPGGESVPPSARAATGNGSGSQLEVVTPARQRVLDALAWFASLGIRDPQRAALAPLAGSKATSGGFKNNLGALRTAGLVDYPQPNCVTLTEEGSAAAMWPERAGTSEELQAAVMETLTPARRAILRALIGQYPRALQREDLATIVGVPATSGGFKNNLGAMRTQGVIDYPAQGMVVAADLLFVGGGRS